jgi:hypothetical protein
MEIDIEMSYAEFQKDELNCATIKNIYFISCFILSLIVFIFLIYLIYTGTIMI